MFGIPTGAASGLVVVDLGSVLPQEAAEFIYSPEMLDGAAFQKTPSGGNHIVYLHDGKYAKNQGHQPGEPDFDVRGDGGYIIAAPSYNDKGSYRWGARPILGVTKTFPREVYDFLEGIQRPRRAKKRVEWQTPERVERGERHPALVSLAGGLFHRGEEPQKIVEALEKYNSELPDPLPPDRLVEIPRIVDWYMEQTEDIEDAFWKATPILSHIQQFSRENFCAPWAVLGSVLARVAVSTSAAVVLPGRKKSGRAPLNFYTALVGEPGAGKDQAMLCADECLDLNLEDEDTFRFGSAEGLLAVFKQKTKEGEEWVRRAALFQESEVETVLSVSSRQGNSLISEMRAAWSGSQLGFSYVDQKKRYHIPAHSYRLAAIIGVQPSKAGVFLSDITGGLPQRMLWMQVIDRFAPDTDGSELDTLGVPRAYYTESLDWERIDAGASGQIVIPVYEGIMREVRDAALRAVRSGGRDAISGHTLQLKLRVAALLAILHGSRAVTSEYWHLAEFVMTKSLEGYRVCSFLSYNEALSSAKRRGHMEGIAAGSASISQAAAKIEACKRRVLVILSRDRWYNKGQLSRRVGPSGRDSLDEALASLVASGAVIGEVIARGVGSPGRPGMRYRLSSENVVHVNFTRR
jgi:hypothetical protein